MTGSAVVHSVATMSRLITFYKTQVEILWKWRGGPVALLKRLVITFVVAVISLIVTAGILPGITVGRLADAAIAVILMALFNAIVRPVILALVAPRLADPDRDPASSSSRSWPSWSSRRSRHGVEVDGFLTALIGSFIYAVINTILTSIWASIAAVRTSACSSRRCMAQAGAPKTDEPGLVIIQIDGLAHPILAGRVRAGSVNTMASWIRDGTHKLSRWEAILPSMTSASQAGILHGNNDGIPAFRWYERDRQKLMVSSNPDDAAEIVRRAVERRGSAVQRRGQHLQSHDRRRHARVRHDGRHQGRVAGPRRQPGLPRLLLQPERLPALVHAVPGRVRQGAVPGAPHAPVGRPAADAPRA